VAELQGKKGKILPFKSIGKNYLICKISYYFLEKNGILADYIVRYD
jgi:hypothetical protein